MKQGEAQRVVELLRTGIPPTGYVSDFTVGREYEIRHLKNRLNNKKTGALLLKANYGSGKTHLLRFIQETALKEGYAVSYIALDSRSAVRFNRMDQIMGAIWRGLELPEGDGQKGLRPFFDMVVLNATIGRLVGPQVDFWKEFTSNGWWTYSNVLDSEGLYAAIRAWSTGDPQAQDLVEDWLYQPWNYRSQRKKLYYGLVQDQRSHFRDNRPDWMFYDNDVFSFHTHKYFQSWAALRDAHKLAKASGLKGLVLLVDEFEDVIQNLGNIQHQESAFWNLFQFYSGKQFPGMSYFAVTPDFVQNCKRLLLSKGRWDYDFSLFEALPTFSMSPLEAEQIEELSMRILEVHGTAYRWEPDLAMKYTELSEIVRRAARVRVQDRARHTIREVVKALDRLLQEFE